MVEAVSLDKKQIQTQQTVDTVQGQSDNGNIFGGLADFAGRLSNACSSAANSYNNILLQNSYVNRIRMLNAIPPVWGWGGCCPILPSYQPFFPVFNPLFGNCCASPLMPIVGGSSGYPFGLTSTCGLPDTRHISVDLDPRQFEVLGGNPINWDNFYASMTGTQTANPGITQTGTTGTSFGQNVNNNIPELNVDALYHPERYRTNNNQQPSEQQRANVTASAAQIFGMKQRPLWYTSILDKDPKKLSAEEKRLKSIYEKNMIENSVYQFDKNGNVQCDDANNYKVNANIYSKIKDLYEAMLAHDDVRVLKLIKQYTPDELSAIDYYWRFYAENSRGDKSGLTLRQMAQKACCYSWFDWTKWKGGNYDAIFKVLNEKTLMNNPSSMADAFHQGIHEESWLNFGIDTAGVIKLLKMLKNNPAYAKAVAEEYGSNFGTSLSDELRNGKLKTNSAEVKRLALEVFE